MSSVEEQKKIKVDYFKMQAEILKNLERAGERPSLLLHACCAPCSSFVIEFLANYFDITIFYYNPNIHPKEEYERRLAELKEFLIKFPLAVQKNVKLVVSNYDVEEYFSAVNTRMETELQSEKERGERCRRCYKFRMEKAWKYASENNFDYFTTTLSISPYKDAPKINEIGYTLDNLTNVKYLPADFKKKNGFLRSLQLSDEYGLYRQDYCGCVYSMRNSEHK